MKTLRVSKTLALPIDAVTEKLSFLGRTGSGKTYGATKLAELMLEAGAQVIAIDPVGKWYGLRLAGDGPGFDIPVFGGLQGDLPLEPSAGALVADIVVDRDISAVIDVSQMTSTEQQRFAAAFAKRLFQRKKSRPSAMHLFIEECQEFLPQNPMRDETATLHEFQRIFKIGRNFGIGGSLISQRPQEVSKKALNQTECLFAFQMTGPQERDAMAKWMSEKGIDPKIAGDLPGLENGECLVWSPGWLRVNERARFSAKRTADVSSTPTVGRKSKAAAPLTPIDIEKLRSAMAETIERAKADDPRELRKRIAELEKQAKEAARAKPAIAAPAPKRIEVNVLDKALVARIEKAAKRAEWALREATDEHMLAVSALESLRATVAKVAAPTIPIPAALQNAHARIAVTLVDGKPVRPKETAVAPRATNGTTEIGKCERAILTVLAQYGARSKVPLAILAGYSSKSGGFRNALSALRTAGYITRDDDIEITDEGEKALGPMEPLPTGPDLLEHWKQNAGGLCERVILYVLAEAYPKGLLKEEIAEKTARFKDDGKPYSAASGGFRNALSRLRSLKLVDGRGELRLDSTLAEAS